MQALGISILALIFAGLFTLTARMEGIKAAALIWGISLVGGAVIVFACFAMTGELG